MSNPTTGRERNLAEEAQEVQEARNRSGDIHLYRDGGKIHVLRSLAIVNVGKKSTRATSGTIVSELDPGIRMVSLSGWVAPKDMSPWVLNPEKYTNLVREVSTSYGFNLLAHKFDNGYKKAVPEHRGRYRASEVEKKLSLWWVRKILKNVLHTRDITRMHEIKGVELPAQMRTATIYLDHRPCTNCMDFLEMLRRVTGITFTTKTTPYLVKGERIKASSWTLGKEAAAHHTARSHKSQTANPVKPGIQYTDAPKRWEFLGNCSKPKNQENALHDAALFLQHEPTKNSPVRRIKVNLTPLEPPKRLEYSKVSVTSCSSIAGSASAAAESQGSLSGVRARLFGGTKSKLDLGKYRYQQPSSADQRKGVVKGGGASRRNMKLLRRSTFKKAVERHYSQLR